MGPPADPASGRRIRRADGVSARWMAGRDPTRGFLARSPAGRSPVLAPLRRGNTSRRGGGCMAGLRRRARTVGGCIKRRLRQVLNHRATSRFRFVVHLPLLLGIPLLVDEAAGHLGHRRRLQLLLLQPSPFISLIQACSAVCGH